jgi:repressor of nif and glnA expression
MKLWIPTLDGFPVGGIKLVETDPLADKNTLANKILSILHASNSFLTSKNIVAALQAEGLAKEPRAISSAVSQALQILKRRKLARSVGHLWMASVNALTKAGTM